MNFMDYSFDVCMYMFTVDQTARIQVAMQTGTYRNQLNSYSLTLCNTTGISENNNLTDNISIFPNPSSGDVFISTTLQNANSIELKVYNSIGESIMSKKINSASGETKVTLNNKPNGIYLFELKTSEGTITKKVILNK